jgi:hypothetical protein
MIINTIAKSDYSGNLASMTKINAFRKPPASGGWGVITGDLKKYSGHLKSPIWGI